jgi:hypothetical protein
MLIGLSREGALRQNAAQHPIDLRAERPTLLFGEVLDLCTDFIRKTDRLLLAWSLRHFLLHDKSVDVTLTDISAARTALSFGGLHISQTIFGRLLRGFGIPVFFGPG